MAVNKKRKTMSRPRKSSTSRVICPEINTSSINVELPGTDSVQLSSAPADVSVFEISNYRDAEQKINDLARFPEENPFPVLRLAADGTILYSNGPGQVLLETWKRRLGQKVPIRWRTVVKTALKAARYRVEEETCGEKIFSFAVAPVPESGYVNLYGRDVTKQKQAEQALEESREDLKHAQAVGSIGSWRLDVRKNELTWSDENHHIFGIPKGTPMTYETFLSTIHPDDKAYVDTQWQAALTGKDYDVEHRIVVEGEIKWVREKAYLEFDKEGVLLGGFGITQDITQRKQMENELRRAQDELEDRVAERTAQLADTVDTLEAEVRQRIAAEQAVQAERRRFHDVLETLPVYICLLTPDYRMPFANRVFREWFDYDLNKKCYEFLFNRTGPCEVCETFSVFQTSHPHRWEWKGPNGRDYDIYDFPFKDTDGSQLILEMGIDITEQKRAEDEIRESHKKLRSLTAQLQLAEERQRRQIAQDLHDSIGQILAFSSLQVNNLQKLVPNTLADSLKDVCGQLNEAVRQVRNLSFDLSPSILYDLGFEIAVEDLVERFSRERNILCRFNNCGTPKPLNDDVKVLLYRSIRELLINAAKHAHPEIIMVSLLRSSAEMHIIVEDNGCGFNASVLADDSFRTKGFGLFSVRERLNHIGGRLMIESAVGKGTKAVLIAPLDFEKTDQ